MIENNTVEVEVRYDRSSQSDLAKKSATITSELGLVINNQESLDRATQVIGIANDWLKAVDRVMDPVRDATHKAWKAAVAAQDEFKRPVEDKMKRLKSACALFIANAQAEAARKQRELEEKQRKENEERAKRVAKELRAEGVTKENIKGIQQVILAKQAPAVEPAVEAPAGMSVRMLYSAELIDMGQFIKHLGTDEYLLRLLAYSQPVKKAIESELRGEATRMKDKYNIPGTILVKKPSGSFRA